MIAIEMVTKVVPTKLSRAVTACPITYGRETKMTAESFSRICAKHRNGPDGYCRQVCQGKNYPDNLQIVTIDEMEEERTMSAQWKKGKCDICGKSGSVRDSNGKTACATCEPLWRGVILRTEQMFGMLREKMGDAWIADRIGLEEESLSGGGDDEVLKLKTELKYLQDAFDSVSLERDIARQNLKEFEEGHEISIRQLNEQYTREEERLRCYINKIEQTVDAMKEKVAYTFSSDNPHRDTAVLDLALQVISGKVVGVTADQLSLLR